MKHSLLVAILTIFLLTTGCNNQSFQKTSQTKPTAAKFHNTEMLTLLINAQLAADARQYKIASENYLSLAQTLEQPEYAKRATLYALRHGNNKTALIAAKLWSRLAPEQTYPAVILSMLLLNSNNAVAALPELEKIFTKPSNTSLKYLYLLMNSFNNPKALDLLAQDLIVLTKKYPNNATLNFSLAVIALTKNKINYALNYINQALQQNPNWIEAKALKAQILIHNKNANEAMQYLQQQLNTHPESAKLKFFYARLLLQNRQIAKSQQLFTELLNNPKFQAPALLNLGRIAYLQQDPELATRLFQKVINNKQYGNQARFLLGKIAQQQKQYKQAIKWYLTIRSGHLLVDAQIQASLLLAKTGELKKAIARVNNIHTSTPAKLKLLTLAKIKILIDAKLLSQAYQATISALKLIPNDADILATQVDLAIELGHYQAAKQGLLKLIKLKPNNVNYLNTLGYLLTVYLKEYQQALPYLKQALKLAPNDPNILDSMGWLQYRLGNNKLALQYLIKAMKLGANAEIAAHFGEVLWQSGHKKEARHIWQEALKRYPENKMLRDTIMRFEPETFRN